MINPLKIDVSALNIFEIYSLIAKKDAVSPPEYEFPGGNCVQEMDVLLDEISFVPYSEINDHIPVHTSEERIGYARKILELKQSALAKGFPAEERSRLDERTRRALSYLSSEEKARLVREDREEEPMQADVSLLCTDF